MSNSDLEHWLWRFDASAWLSAAQNELDMGRSKIEHRRTCLTHARRAAGMALNAVLVELAKRKQLSRAQAETHWGRSYMDHLRLLVRTPDPFDEAFAQQAQTLSEMPIQAPDGLVALGAARNAAGAEALRAAQYLFDAIRSFIDSSDGGR